MFYFKKQQLYWIDLLKKDWKLDCTHLDHSQLDPLPFKITYTNIVLVLKSWSACATTKNPAQY